MVQLRPTPSVLDIAARLEEAGFEAWCVGGAIRDALLGDAPLDWDLASPARPEQVQALFGRRRTIPVGIEFGTVSVLDGAGIAHEITTFRRDVRTDGRHAVVEFGATLEEDLARRDFTINAIAYRPLTHEMRDPFGGRRDLDGRVLRAVGDAEARMREDRLRALRAIRFAARFSLTIEPATRTAIENSSPHLTRLSAERVQQELFKSMQQVPSAGAAIRLWRDSGAVRVLLPALGDISETSLATLDLLPRDAGGRAPQPQRTSNRLAALFLDVTAGEARRTLTALRFSKHETSWVSSIVERWQSLSGEMTMVLSSRAPSDAEVRRWLARLGRLHAGGFLRVATARWNASRGSPPTPGSEVPSAAAVCSLHRRMRRSQFRDPIDLGDLRIDGDDLRRLGIPTGPIYAKILHALLERVLEDPARNTPEALLTEVPGLAASLSSGTGTSAHHSTER